MTALIPATVLTGFLGAGKSTLLRRVLTERHGRGIVVIEHEFGEENIDNEIIVMGDERITQLNNGCLCCSMAVQPKIGGRRGHSHSGDQDIQVHRQASSRPRDSRSERSPYRPFSA